MFPLVLPSPLSKKCGAKLAWARKKTPTNGHPDTRRNNFASARSGFWPLTWARWHSPLQP